jgi:PAS domain S-box-containing protein
LSQVRTSGGGEALLRPNRTLAVFVVAAVVAPLLLLAALAAMDWRRLEREVQVRSARTATALAEQAQRVFDANAAAIARADERARGMSWDQIRSSQELNLFLRNLVAEVRLTESIGFADPHGALAALSRVFPAPPAPGADRDYFRAQLSSDAGVFVGEVVDGRAGGGMLFRLSRRRSSADRGFDGVVFAAVAPQAFSDFYRSIVDPGDSVTLARADGAVLARYPGVTTGVATLPPNSGLMRSLRSAPQGGTYKTTSDLDNVDRLHAYMRVGGYPVYVSFGTNPAAIVREWRTNLASYGAISLLSAALLALVGGAALTRAGGERRALAQAQAAIEAEARAQMELSRARERDARDAAEASEGRFRRLVEANMLPMAFGRLDGGIIEANDAFLGLIGYPRRELAEGRLRLDALTPPEYRGLDDLAMRELLASGRSQPYEKEYVRRDGRRIPILVASTLLAQGGDGEQLIAKSVIDLTERQRSAEALNQERQAVASSEERLRAIFDSAPVGLALAEAPGGRILRVNGAMQRLVARDRLDAGVAEWGARRPDGQLFDPAAHPLTLALAGEERPSAEMLCPQADGGGWISVTAAPIRAADGRITGGVLTVVDIDRERRALDATRRLVDELNHRVKNTLAAVQSIAHQTLRAGAPPEQARRAFEGRLMALSTIHNVLTRENWDAAGLPELLEAMARLHPDAAGRWRAQGPQVRLPPRMALPLSMAFQELFSNAERHGALSAKGGEVVVSWILRNGQGGGSDLEIEWRESGGPPAAPPQREGFGLRMLRKNLGLELDGAADVDFAPSGVVCRIRMPLRMPGLGGDAHVA